MNIKESLGKELEVKKDDKWIFSQSLKSYLDEALTAFGAKTLELKKRVAKSGTSKHVAILEIGTKAFSITVGKSADEYDSDHWIKNAQIGMFVGDKGDKVLNIFYSGSDEGAVSSSSYGG